VSHSRMVTVSVDGRSVEVPDGSTLLDALVAAGLTTPTLCYGPTIVAKNVCRVCVVELEGSRALVPSCSRRAEDGMVLHTDSDRVRHSRRMVLELLGSSVDLSHTADVDKWMAEYGADPSRHHVDDHEVAAVVQPIKIDNDLYVRDYAKCILCYQCVDACGEQWQGTFAIAVAGRGFDSTISTEWDAPLTDSACVYCGNCIAVCPTGALVGKVEHDMRAEGMWDEERQDQTTTVCAYCGVGCNVTLHTQDGKIVKVTSPSDHSITHGNLCIKGRFGWTHVES
jgi:predicted molibdopterin-dependent oxidoreductase YjgC